MDISNASFFIQLYYVTFIERFFESKNMSCDNTFVIQYGLGDCVSWLGRNMRSPSSITTYIDSFKKFAFTTMTDTLDDIVTHVIKRKCVFTYYGKRRDERTTGYQKMISNLLVFSRRTESRE